MNPNDMDGHPVGENPVPQNPDIWASKNGGEQDSVVQNADPGYYDAPQAIISSEPEPSTSNAGSTNSFLSSRSNRRQRAVESSKFRQNAPEFFQQNMAQQDIIINSRNEQAAANKKKLFLFGGIGLGVIALIVALILIIPALTGGNSEASQLDELQAFLNDESASVYKYDTLLKAAGEDSYALQAGISDEEYESSKSELNSNFDSVKKFQEKLASFKNVSAGNEELDKKLKDSIADLSTSLEKSVVSYEKYKNTIIALNDVYKNYGSEESIKNFSEVSDSQYASYVTETITQFYSFNNSFGERWMSGDCNNKYQTTYCTTLLAEKLTVEENYNNDTNLAKLLKSYNPQDIELPSSKIAEVLGVIDEINELNNKEEE